MFDRRGRYCLKSRDCFIKVQTTDKIVTCRGLHVTGVIRFVPELLLWIQVTLCISYFSLYS